MDHDHEITIHQTVLLHEIVQALNLQRGGRYIDATLGEGGHTKAIVEQDKQIKVLGIDWDHEMLGRAKKRLQAWKERCFFEKGNFADMKLIADKYGWHSVDGIVMDVGFCSAQIESAQRGFSFKLNGPLDMRMDQDRKIKAMDIVNNETEENIVHILKSYGEERSARRIARRIMEERNLSPIQSTEQLADIIVKVKGWQRSRIHPATKTFQALRIAVNEELDNLERGLKAAVNLLKEGGRLAVISFHSLEDRMIKHFFKEHEGKWVSLAQGGQQWIGKNPPLKRISKKPIQPSEYERMDNPRARSAKLRIVERVSAYAS
jgi:16S rRNA (cytosine1402-N4)-methyltransferase